MKKRGRSTGESGTNGSGFSWDMYQSLEPLGSYLSSYFIPRCQLLYSRSFGWHSSCSQVYGSTSGVVQTAANGSPESGGTTLVFWPGAVSTAACRNTTSVACRPCRDSISH